LNDKKNYDETRDVHFSPAQYSCRAIILLHPQTPRAFPLSAAAMSDTVGIPVTTYEQFALHASLLQDSLLSCRPLGHGKDASWSLFYPCQTADNNNETGAWRGFPPLPAFFLRKNGAANRRECWRVCGLWIFLGDAAMRGWRI